MEHAIGRFALSTGGLTAQGASRTGSWTLRQWCSAKTQTHGASAFERCGCTVCPGSRWEMPSSLLHHLGGYHRYLCCTAARAGNVMALVCHPLGATRASSALDMRSCTVSSVAIACCCVVVTRVASIIISYSGLWSAPSRVCPRSRRQSQPAAWAR